jgi:hypothetical protein
MGITSALQLRHKDDLFLTEVKDGATQTRAHRRLDGWALLKTWSPVTTIGYEFKVTRADWLQDRKWESYLPLVHQFYVCAPKGIIQLGELPESVGLLELLGNDRLVTRRKAARREIELPGHLLLYVLMSRVTPSTYDSERKANSRAAWEQWLRQSESDATLGRLVRGRIRDLYDKAEGRARQAERKAEAAARVEETLVRLGLSPDRVLAKSWNLERDLMMQLSGSAELLTAVRRAQGELREVERLLSSAQRVKAGGEAATSATPASTVEGK